MKKSNINLLEPKFNYIGNWVGFNLSYFNYGHIKRGDNHYQFYFDFEKLIEDDQKQLEIKSWARDINVEKDAFNIVISPLQITNASFLKIVLDNTFGSNLHLLHININETGKESIRTKFSYISEELKKIYSAYSKVNFYYIDDSICTGAGVARAYKFLVTICSQAQIDLKKWFSSEGTFKFTKVFLLINRCSYETALTWVKDPIYDWHGFINLCVPSYNTHSNTCPGCRIKDRYDLLRKRSATNELTSHFDGQAKKHAARDPKEYDLWIRNEMETNSTYFTWFRLWLNSADDSKLKKIIKDVNILEEFENEIESLKYNISEYYKYVSKYCKDAKELRYHWIKLSLKDFFDWLDLYDKNNKNKKIFCTELMLFIKAEDNFLRLKTMNEAYKQLIYDKSLFISKVASASDKIDFIEKRIWAMLKKLDIDNSYDYIMGLLSYIKVISRDYLAKNYYVRAAMQRVLIQLFNDLTRSKQIIDKNSDAVEPVLVYRYFKNIIHRLALMRSDFIIYHENIKRIALTCNLMEKNYNIKEQHDSNKIFGTLPTVKDMISDFIASIKTATMEESDDGMCFKLLDSLKKFQQEGLEVNSNVFKQISVDIIGKISHTLIIENNRMIYDFMEELSNRCTSLGKPIDSKWKYEGYIGEGGLEKRKNILGDLKTSVDKLIQQSDNGKLYQNPLSSFIRFYYNIFNITDKVTPDKIAEMLNAFNICRFLTEPEFKIKRHEEFESLPYIFEDLCLSIKNMTDSLSCCFVYKKKGELSQLVARSGYVIDKEANDSEFVPMDNDEDKFSTIHIGSSMFDLIIKCFENDKNIRLYDKKTAIKLSVKNEIVDGVKIITSNQNYENNHNSFDHFFYVFDLPVKNDGKVEESIINKNDNKDERHFYIILEMNSDICEAIEKQLNIILRVLFLRNRLWEALNKYYSSLLNFRFYVNYIRPINKTGSKVSLCNVMHISDLHLDDDETWHEDGWKWTTLFGRLIEFKGSVELIAVTGDIIDHPNDANDAQRKYKRVANLLFEIAKCLWGSNINGNMVLPHDWKRRILITTGNHDYAAMNDVRVRTKSRKIETGLPASSSGGTMSRFTYYIEFLSYFLDAPTQRLLKNDLNEVRHYKNLKLVVGIINSCSTANALQNNKVSIDRTSLEYVLENTAWDQSNDTKLVLMHHSPFYKIDYFDDKYEIWKWDFEGFKELYDDYRVALMNMLNDEGYPVGKSISKAHTFIQKFANIVESSKYIDKKVFVFRESVLYKDMQMLYEILLGDNKQPHEYSEAFKAMSSNLAIIQSEDQANLEYCRSLIIKKGKVYFLAGHEHCCNNIDDALAPTFLVGKLYESMNKPMWFEILRIDNKGVNRDINMYKYLMWWYESCCEKHKDFISKNL